MLVWFMFFLSIYQMPAPGGQAIVFPLFLTHYPFYYNGVQLTLAGAVSYEMTTPLHCCLAGTMGLVSCFLHWVPFEDDCVRKLSSIFQRLLTFFFFTSVSLDAHANFYYEDHKSFLCPTIC